MTGRLIMGGVLAASWMLTPQAGDGRLPSGKPPCKMLPVVVSSVSTSAAARTTSNYTARYDRATNQLHTDVTYQHSSGTRQQMHYVHYYESLADFINEVSIVPPLKLYTRAVTSGDVQMASTNSFDAQRRQTGFVNTIKGSPTQTTTYTAWDPKGRPAKGTRTGQPGSGPAAVDIVYDDVARTMTTTVRTPTASGPMLFVDVETFDENGNVRRYEMKSSGAPSVTTNTLHKLESICRDGTAPGLVRQPGM